jgi:hypothetical protein
MSKASAYLDTSRLHYLLFESVRPDFEAIITNRQTRQLIAPEVVGCRDAFYADGLTIGSNLGAVNGGATFVYNLSFN